MLSIVIPVYNEKEYVKEVIDNIYSLNIEKEIVVVDDGSTDGSTEILTGDKRIKLVVHRRNSGKGASIKSGLKEAEGDYVVVQDADFEYNPEELELMYKTVKKLDIPVLYGNRFGGNSDFLRLSYVANKVLTLMTNLLYKIHISDMETCYKLIKRRIIESMSISARRFEFEPEVTVKLIKKGIKIYETPVNYSGRKTLEGKKIGFRDFLEALSVLFKHRFSYS